MKKILAHPFIALALVACAFLLLYNPLTHFPYSLIIVSCYILGVTLAQDGNLSKLNFKRISLHHLKIIVASFLALELIMDLLVQPMANYFLNEPVDYSAFESLEGQKILFFKWLLQVWISAAFGEELLFRGFVFAQLEKMGVSKKYPIVFISALLFCLPHWYQSPAGIFTTFVFGIAFGLMYSHWKHLWINVMVHGLIDTVFLTLCYLGYLDWYKIIL